MINLNEYLRGDDTQIMILSELTLILFSISSKKDIYLDIINNSDQNIINNFLHFLEKYLFFDIGDESLNFNQQNSEEIINNIKMKENTNLNTSNYCLEPTCSNFQNISNIINLNNQLSLNLMQTADLKKKFSENKILEDSNLEKNNSDKTVFKMNNFLLDRKTLTSANLEKINIDSNCNQISDLEENKYKNNVNDNNNQSNNITSPLLNTTGVFNKTKTKTFIKKMDFGENEKKKLLSTIEILKKEVSSYTEKNEELSNNFLDLELKYKDCLREIEILHRNNTNQLSVQADSYNDVILLASIRNELMKKELEIEEIKRDYELDLKRYSDELFKSRQKMEILEDKIENLKYYQYENEKLKIKIKEFNMFKDKISDYDNLVSCVESKNVQIEKLIKEKQILLLQNENTIKDLLHEREKLKLVEFEKKKLDYELYDLKKDFSRFEPRSNSTNQFKVQNLRDNRYSLIFKSKSKRMNSSKNEIENLENNTLAGTPLSVINKNNYLNIPGYITNNNSKIICSKNQIDERSNYIDDEEDNFKTIKNFIDKGESRNLNDKNKTEKVPIIKNFLDQIDEENIISNEEYKKTPNTNRDNNKIKNSFCEEEKIIKNDKKDYCKKNNKNTLNEDSIKNSINTESKNKIKLISPKKISNNSSVFNKGSNVVNFKLDTKNINNVIKHEEINLHTIKNTLFNDNKNNNQFNNLDNQKLSDFNKREKLKDDTNDNNVILMSGSSDDSIDQATFNALEAEFFDIKARYEELNESYKEQMDSIQKINLEKDGLIKINEQNKIEIQNLISMIDKTIIEKEKIEISLQKSEIEYQKLLLIIDKLENEKRKFFDENIEIKQKINIMINDKEMLKNEIGEVKKQMKLKSNQIEKLLKEKKDMVNESLKVNYPTSPMKNRKTSILNTTNFVKTNPKNSSLLVNKKNHIEDNELKIEIAKLKVKTLYKLIIFLIKIF